MKFSFDKLVKEDLVLKKSSLDQCRNDANSICKMLDRSNIWYELVDYDMYPMNTSKISFEVNGDWKHDHWAFKDILNDWAEENNRDIFKIDEEEIGESQSDDYTARYDVFITSDKDSYNMLNSMRGLFSEGLSKSEKKIYADAVNKAEDLEDLEDICHEIYFYDKKLFAHINKFPKDASVEDVKANMLKYLQDTEETKKESLKEAFGTHWINILNLDPEDLTVADRNAYMNWLDDDKQDIFYAMKESDQELLVAEHKFNSWFWRVFDGDEKMIDKIHDLKQRVGTEDRVDIYDSLDEGTHGKFDTKKEVDTQRRSLFASGYNEDYERPGYEDMYFVCYDDTLGDYHEAKVKAKYPQDAIDKVIERKNVYQIIDCKKIDMFIPYSSARIRKAEVVESLTEDFSDFNLINYNDFLANNFNGWSDDMDDLMKEISKCARALKTISNKLVFYVDYDEDFYALDNIAKVVKYIGHDYSLYQLNDLSGIYFVFGSDNLWIFRNEKEANYVISQVKAAAKKG